MLLNPEIIARLQSAHDRLIEDYCTIASEYCFDVVIPFVQKYQLSVIYSAVEQDWGFFDPSTNVTLRSWMTRPDHVPKIVSEDLTNEFVNIILPIMLVPFPGRDRVVMGSLIVSTITKENTKSE